MNTTTMTAKNAVKKNTDLTIFSFKRETIAALPGDFPAEHSDCVMVYRLPVGKKVRSEMYLIQLFRATYPWATTICWPAGLRRKLM